MGQKKEELVMLAITKIMLLSIGLCTMVCLAVNIFPELFFGLFGQGKEFIEQGIPVLRVVTTGLLFMSIANIWLNGVYRDWKNHHQPRHRNCSDHCIPGIYMDLYESKLHLACCCLEQ
jgi:Na+-driven multidrug efflux pump